MILSAGLQGEIDQDGWVSIERSPKKELHLPTSEENGTDIWVVFGKQIESEKILISFPEDPDYRYIGNHPDEMEVLASVNGVEHRLQIIKESFSNEDSLLSARVDRLTGAKITEQESKLVNKKPRGRFDLLAGWVLVFLKDSSLQSTTRIFFKPKHQSFKAQCISSL